jgi:hypothetical protein
VRSDMGLLHMTPAGYMAKRISKRPDWLKAAVVEDVYSVSSCVSEDFGDYISDWKHNGYWFFDSPQIIRNVAQGNSIQLEGTSLFYYEAYEMEFDGESWASWSPETSIPTNVVLPPRKHLEGFDAVSFSVGTNPECSPLSCNSMAEGLHTHPHCLFESFDEAKSSLDNGSFKDCESGPYRIFSVYSVDWF